MTPMRSATRRRMYAGGRPNRLARLLNRGQAAVHSAGIWPKRLATLEVRGRRSGRLVSLPVVIADYEGERYLVAMLGGGRGMGRQHPRGGWTGGAASRAP